MVGSDSRMTVCRPRQAIALAQARPITPSAGGGGGYQQEAGGGGAQQEAGRENEDNVYEYCCQR